MGAVREGASARLTDWLGSADLAHPSGHCLSWHNPQRPGYPYPEITGLLLSYLCRTGGSHDRRDALIRALLNESPRGPGRGGVTFYAFDTAMALSGLLTAVEDDDTGSARSRADHRAPPRPAVRTRVREWSEVVGASVRAGRSTEPQVPLTEETRWSDSFGCHQSKLAGSLVRYARWAGQRQAVEPRATGRQADGPPGDQTPAGSARSALAAADALIEPTLALAEPDGRFRVHRLADATYAHAHCYAMEGLVAQTTRPDLDPATTTRVRSALAAGARWLASVQRKDGGVLAWYSGGRPHGPARADATAQALRLWLLTGPGLFAAQIDSAAAFLRDLQVAGGGVRYEPGSPDINSWASIFTGQALGWSADGPDPQGLI
jgi:hypothetical protein